LAREKFFLLKVKFVDKCMKALGYDNDKWLAVWTNTALPTIIKEISLKRSNLMHAKIEDHHN
jgi:hypothetical protein